MNLETGLSVYVADLDFTSIYPSDMVTLNVSRMTLTFVPFKIEGKNQSDVRRYFSNLISVRENASVLCSEYMGLPSYTQMAELIINRLGNNCNVLS